MNLANQPVRAVPKPDHNRSAPRRGVASKFSSKTIRAICERDNYRCVRCGSHYIESVPHHVIYRSAGGKGTVDNGVTICRPCHDLAHSSREVRKWFEAYRIKHLLEASS